MTDTRNLGEGAFGPEPEHDPELAALLRDVCGETPLTAVNWNRLAARIAERVGIQPATPWWAYAMQWERRVIPLALAAGIAASVALFAGASANPAQAASASALSTDVAAGTLPEEAAVRFANSVTDTVDITAGVPE